MRPDAGKTSWKDPFNAPLSAPWMESQPPTPKSVRPPLPGDVDAELRAACTWIVTHPKPSHERWDNTTSKPALDYQAIKYAEAGPVSSVPALAKRHSVRSKEPSKQDLLPDSTKYSYRPNVAAEDLFRPTDVAAKTARSRVEQLMAPEVPRSVTATTSSRQRSGSHSHSHSASAQHPHIARTEAVERKRISTRSDSIGTSGSTPHTDSTEYPWSASTAMTSAVMTPARSKRTSTQAMNVGGEGGLQPKAKVDAINAEWMRLELEKHFRTHEKVKEREHEQELEQDEPVLCSATYIPSGTSPRYSRDFSHVPARKPVPSRNSSMQPSRVPRPATGQSIRGRSSPSRRGRAETTGQEERGRSPPRAYSRIGRASRAASRAASEAATRAGSIANEIFVHLDRRPTQAAQTSSEARRSPSKAPSQAFSRGPGRSPSRARSISRHVKEYFRPGSSMSMRKSSIDSSGRSTTTPSEDPSERGRGWRFLNRGRSTFDLSRPGSSASRATTGEPQSPRPAKPVVDLNRELPPLPSLDKWDGAQTENDRPRAKSPASTLARAPSKMDMTKNPHVARMATRTSSHQQTSSYSSSPGASVVHLQSQNWRPATSETLAGEPEAEALRQRFRGEKGKEQPYQQTQRVPRPQPRGVVPASNRNGFVDPDSATSSPIPRAPRSATINSGQTRESHNGSQGAEDARRFPRGHERSPTVDEKVKRKWWPSNLRRSPSQTGRMDSVIRPTSGMPTV